MAIALILGLVIGCALVVYQGIYMGPWDQVLHTMGMSIMGCVILYIILHIVASIGSFILRIVIVLAVLGLLGFGGFKLWEGSIQHHSYISGMSSGE